MTTIAASESSRTLTLSLPVSWLFLTAGAIPRILSGAEESQATVVSNDTITTVTTYSSAITCTDYQLNAFFMGSGSPVYSSSDTNIATVSSTGKVSYVSNGTVTVTGSVRGVASAVTLTMAQTIGPGGTSPPVFVSFSEGWLAYHMSNEVDSRIQGKTAAASLALYTTQNHTSGTYVRNPEFWATGVDLTPISPWNSYDGPRRAGTLISPRHVLFAAHYPLSAGQTIRFVKTDNTVVTRTITALLVHPSYVPYYPDLQVGVLDQDVPAGITFAKVLPAEAISIRLPGLQYGVPVFFTDQEEKATVRDWTYADNLVVCSKPTAAARLEFYEDIVVGDSGNPCFGIINGELVLLTVATSGGAGSGTSVTKFIADINTMMTQLGGGYQLTQIDISSFAG